MSDSVQADPVRSTPPLSAGHDADSLVPLIYAELRAAAGRLMGAERTDHTLQPTALVHEAYAKLPKAGVQFQDDSHFFYAAAQAMRRILLDHALARGRKKRGGKGRIRVELTEVDIGLQNSEEMDFQALDA